MGPLPWEDIAAPLSQDGGNHAKALGIEAQNTKPTQEKGAWGAKCEYSETSCNSLSQTVASLAEYMPAGTTTDRLRLHAPTTACDDNCAEAA